VRIAEVVAMHVADEHDVDLAQARIVGAGHGAARVVEHAGAVRIFEDQGPVLRAELAVDAARAA
jgi:HD superfamily phosphohydrolase YqeK